MRIVGNFTVDIDRVDYNRKLRFNFALIIEMFKLFPLELAQIRFYCFLMIILISIFKLWLYTQRFNKIMSIILIFLVFIVNNVNKIGIVHHFGNIKSD